MYSAHDEELEDEQCMPLTGVNCAEIDEALRSLSESAKESCGRTFEETRKLLKQVCRVGSWPLQDTGSSHYRIAWYHEMAGNAFIPD